MEWLPLRTRLWKLPVPLMLLTFLFLFVVELERLTMLVTRMGFTLGPWLPPPA